MKVQEETGKFVPSLSTNVSSNTALTQHLRKDQIIL